MAYINKRTTLILFLLLITSIIFFISSIVYYQRSLTSLNDDIRNKRIEVDNLKSSIQRISLNLSSLSETLDVQIKREENLSGQYVSLKDEKETIESENFNLKTNLEKTMSELIEAKTEINRLENERYILEQINVELNDSLKDVIDDVEYICSKVSHMNLSDCRDYT